MMKIPKRHQVEEALLAAKETAEAVIFGIVMYFHVPYTDYKNRKSKEAERKLKNWEFEYWRCPRNCIRLFSRRVITTSIA
jgi:hypothetical protein